MENKIIKNLNSAFKAIDQGRDIEGLIPSFINLFDVEPKPSAKETLDAINKTKQLRATFFQTLFGNISFGDAIQEDYMRRYDYNDIYNTLQSKDLDRFTLSDERQRIKIKRLLNKLDTQNYSSNIPIQTFTQDEVTLFTKIIDKVTVPKTQRAAVDFRDQLSRMTTTSATALKNRKNTYQFWTNVEKNFDALIKQLNDSGIEYEGDVPSYIVSMGPVTLREIVNPKSPIIVDVIRNKYIQEEIEEEIEYVGTGVFNESGIEGFTAEVGQKGDREYISALQSIKEGLDSIEGAMISGDEIILDPILAIILQDEELPVVLDSEQIKVNVERVMQGLRDNVDEEDLEFLQQTFDEYKNTMEKNLKMYEPIIRKLYKFAIMDGPEFSRAVLNEAFEDEKGKTIRGTYDILTAEYSNGKYSVVSKKFTRYGDLVDYINTETNKFMKYLTTQFDVESWTVGDKTVYTTPQPRRMKRETRLTGGGTPIIPVRRAERRDVPKNLSKLVDAIQDYYIKPFSVDINLDDLPNFTKSQEYKSVERLLSKDLVSLLAAEFASGRQRPQYTKDMFLQINAFLKLANQGQLEVYDGEIKTNSELFISSMTNLLQPVGRDNYEPVIKNITILIGAKLNSVWSDSIDSKKQKTPTFQNRPLTYWANKYDDLVDAGQDPSISFVNLARLFEDEVIREYLESDGAVSPRKESDDVVRIIYGTNGIVDNLMKAGETLSKMASVVLQSYDLIRKSQGLPIHVGYLDLHSSEDMEYIIDKIDSKYNLDIYGKDIDKIVKSSMTMKELVSTLGIPHEVVYHIRGMFR